MFQMKFKSIMEQISAVDRTAENGSFVPTVIEMLTYDHGNIKIYVLVSQLDNTRVSTPKDGSSNLSEDAKFIGCC